MRLRDVFLYLHNSNSANLDTSNIERQTVVIQSDTSMHFDLDHKPFSKDHVFIFQSGKLVDLDVAVNNKQVIFATGSFSANDILNVFYFVELPSSHPQVGPNLTVDTFNGGDDHYILSVGALDDKCILVTKNGKVQYQYSISDGVLSLYNTYITDKIVVFYLNRGYVERRAKLSLEQLSRSSLDTRYAVNNLIYNKPEIDNILCNLRNNAPIGIVDLRNYAEVVGNFKSNVSDLNTQISNLSNSIHDHDEYYSKHQADQVFNQHVNINDSYANHELDALLNTKINNDDIYSRTEIDRIFAEKLNASTVYDRGMFIGGAVSQHSDTNSIDYINISILSDSTMFGTFQTSRRGLSATSNGKNNTGLITGGSVANNVFGTTSIFSMSMLNSAFISYFGDLYRDRTFAVSDSNGTGSIAIVMSGNCSIVEMEYRVIGSRYTSGNIFGDMSVAASKTTSASMSSGLNSRIVFGPAAVSDTAYNLEYINPTNLSNSKTFANCTPAIEQMSGTSNDVNDRGIFAGGINVLNRVFVDNIEFVNIPVQSNSGQFGKLATPKSRVAATSNGVNNRAVFAGGNVGGNPELYNYDSSIEYVGITLNSNSSVFGSLSLSRGDGVGSCSNSAL